MEPHASRARELCGSGRGVHEVAVTPEGYEYRGEIYKGLSPIADRITGTRWSGAAFFGAKPQERRK